jgi:hypothetical protein
MSQKLVEFFENYFWSKEGCLDYFFKKNGLNELTIPTRDLNLILN